MEEKFFTTEQVANILQVHPFTILKFIKQGKLKGVKLGRVYRIKESDIQHFIEERMTQTKEKKENAPEKQKKEVKAEKEQEIHKISTEEENEDHYFII